jgi:ectoine hydroxylase-related dioxygenase (phytanoyl-CoA dioxygenase family)
MPASIDPGACDRAVATFKRFVSLNEDKFAAFRDAHGHYPRLVNFHLAIDDLLPLFSQNRILALTDFLFQAETVLYTSLFYERGSAQDVHRDTPYFTTRPEYRYFGIWVALEDTDAENGPLVVVPGGHLLPELPRSQIARELWPSPEDAPDESLELWEKYQARVHEQTRRLGLVAREIHVKKGDTIIWHPHLPHGGAAINDLTRTRFSLVMHVTPFGAPVYHQKAFFNPAMPLPEAAPWSYKTGGGRRYAAHALVSIGHQAEYKPREFRRF